MTVISTCSLKSHGYDTPLLRTQTTTTTTTPFTTTTTTTASSIQGSYHNFLHMAHFIGYQMVFLRMDRHRERVF